MERRTMRLAAVAALALSSSAAAFGCRGLLGIDEDVPLLSAADAGPGGEGSVGADGDVGLGADGGSGTDGASTSDAALMAVDRRYAQWPMPPTSPLLSQYDLATDVVTDKITSLVWPRAETVPDTMSYPAAVAYCDALTLAGQSDWRLPTRIELLTILDYGRATGGLLSSTLFPNGSLPGATSGCWTASLSLLRAKLDDHMIVDVVLGNVNVTDIAQTSLLARCVRGGPTTSPVERFVIGSGTARDVRTGLLWQLAPIATTQTLAEAGAACSALSLGGFASGWRLPTVRELVSLVDEAREVAPLLPPMFAAGPEATFWSGTERTNPASANFGVDFATANISPHDFTTEKHAARCVH